MTIDLEQTVKCPKCGTVTNAALAAGVCPKCGTILYDDSHSESISEDFNDPRWLPIGTVLNQRYKVIKCIGAGGFGITYKVQDSKTGAFKAVKEYFQQGVVNRVPGTTDIIISASKRSEEFEYGRKRLLQEARIVAKFESPSIVKIDDYFEENHTSYMVMEYLEYHTLEDHLKNKGRVLTADEAVNIGVKLCDALSEVHKAGIIHRDIAPDNIFISPEGEVKIIDFGSSRLSKQDTEDWFIVIKPGFAPPEQYDKINLKNDLQQGWTDVYALGAVLYYITTGKIPAESFERKISSDNNIDPVVYPAELNPSIPEYLSNAIMMAMAINIHERFKTAAQFKEALLQERKVLPIEKQRRNKRRRRFISIAASIMIVGIIAMLGWRKNETRKAEEILAPADITIWYPYDEKNETDKSAALGAIESELENSEVYSNINIELVPVPETVYEDRLNEASDENKMPTIFVSLDPDAKYMSKAEDIKDIISDASGECNYIGKYAKDTKMIPMGFHVPIIYINKTLIADAKDVETVSKIDELMQLDAGEIQYMPMAINPKDVDIYERMFSDFDQYKDLFEGYTKEDFLNKEAVLYLSDSSDYFDVRESMPSDYMMIPIASKQVVCRFSECWSIKDCDGAEQIAAHDIVRYFLENYSQDIYFLQSSIPGLPVEKTALQNYPSVRRVFQKFIDDSDEYSF